MSDTIEEETLELKKRVRSSSSSGYMRRVGEVELNARNCYQNDMDAGSVKVVRGPKENKEEIERPAKWAVTSHAWLHNGVETVLSAFATKAEAINFLREAEAGLKAVADEEE